MSLFSVQLARIAAVFELSDDVLATAALWQSLREIAYERRVRLFQLDINPVLILIFGHLA